MGVAWEIYGDRSQDPGRLEVTKINAPGVSTGFSGIEVALRILARKDQKGGSHLG